jgi:hypothetical protein
VYIGKGGKNMDKEPEVVEAEVIECKGASDFQKGLAVFFVIMSMLYAVSPIDLAPDAIPVIGWLDDIGFLATATMNAIQQFTKDQNSSMVKILKYTKWLLIVATVIAALLLGGLIAAIVALIVK